MVLADHSMVLDLHPRTEEKRFRISCSQGLQLAGDSEGLRRQLTQRYLSIYLQGRKQLEPGKLFGGYFSQPVLECRQLLIADREPGCFGMTAMSLQQRSTFVQSRRYVELVNAPSRAHALLLAYLEYHHGAVELIAQAMSRQSNDSL